MILIKTDCSSEETEVLKSISAALLKGGRRLIRFAQTPSTCHDLEIRLKEGKKKEETKENYSILNRYFQHYSRRGSNIVSMYWIQAHLVKIPIKVAMGWILDRGEDLVGEEPWPSRESTKQYTLRFANC